MTLIAWYVVRRFSPPRGGGLGVSYLHAMNLALLTKKVGKIMDSSDDLVMLVLTNNYVTGDWEGRMVLVRGASAFGRECKKYSL